PSVRKSQVASSAVDSAGPNRSDLCGYRDPTSSGYPNNFTISGILFLEISQGRDVMSSTSGEQIPSVGALESEQQKMDSKAVAAQSPPSDNDGGERPVRQQLKETNLNSVGQTNGSTKASRKRSLDNTDQAADARPTKRSRECTPDDTKISHKPSTEANPTPADTAPQDVSASELDSDPPTPPLPTEHNYPGVNGNGFYPGNHIITVQMPLTLDIKIGFAGTEQTRKVTIPISLEINSKTGEVDLASSISGPAMSYSQNNHINVSIDSSPPSSFATGCSSQAPPVPDFLRDSDSPKPTVETLDSDHSPSPQNLESINHGNEDDSSQVVKKKRSREQLEDGGSNDSHAATDPAPSLTETTTSNENSTTEGQPDKKRPRDNSEERKAKVDQTFTASAFGKASAGSPFALGASNSAASPFAMPAKPSAFGASPFATSGASTTGFGALGSGSGFSAFGSGLSGSSGKLTSFASPNAPASFSGTAGKLTSFASSNAPTSFGDSKDKTLGAAQSDNEESDNEGEGEGDDTFVAEKTDERFHEQTIETGEENETTEYSAKGKLYYFDDKKWKERGAGTFKVNLKSESDGKKSARMIMRADGAHRVMLNSAIWDTMPFGVKGQRPATKDIYLASKEDEKVSTLLLRLGSNKQSSELYDVLEDIVEQI
ncbi:hypothetical protein N7457_002515, partial [Penicillium paradoxum]|uniref:uncharacterized protein n=1 Tax=Penicillium paradoxum TaxID=176176 RepID=UPI0025493BA7